MESRIGKINAFLKGVREARSDLVSIIDDDNFIEPGFIFYTLELFDRHPNVGIVGSTNHIYTDQILPPWFTWAKARYGCAKPFLSEIELQDPSGIVLAQTGIIAGAGSTFRVKLLLDCLNRGYEFFNDTQRGKKMKVTGEDTELCWLLRSLGCQVAYDPRIQIRHAIKPDRLNLEHFEVLCRTIGAGAIGYDPFMFTQNQNNRKQNPLQLTWQWQLLSKFKRYALLIFLPENVGSSQEERRFRNWMLKVECYGAIQRILTERGKYTKHIRQVAFGDWTELRIR